MERDTLSSQTNQLAIQTTVFHQPVVQIFFSINFLRPVEYEYLGWVSNPRTWSTSNRRYCRCCGVLFYGVIPYSFVTPAIGRSRRSLGLSLYRSFQRSTITLATNRWRGTCVYWFDQGLWDAATIWDRFLSPHLTNKVFEKLCSFEIVYNWHSIRVFFISLFIYWIFLSTDEVHAKKMSHPNFFHKNRPFFVKPHAEWGIVKTYSPSQGVFLTPLSGQLDAAFKLKPAAAPPLSVENTITQSLRIFFLLKASTIWPTDLSNLFNMPNKYKIKCSLKTERPIDQRWFNTGVFSSIVSFDGGKFGYVFVRYGKRIVGITGMHRCVCDVQKQWIAGVVLIDDSYRFLCKNIGWILTVVFPRWI